MPPAADMKSNCPVSLKHRLGFESKRSFMSNNEKLLQVFGQLFGVDPKELNDGSSQDTIPNWDSMGMVHLVAELEQVFEVQFELLEIAEFRNIGIIKSILAEKGIEFESREDGIRHAG
jgi:acyl carrier protein